MRKVSSIKYQVSSKKRRISILASCFLLLASFCYFFALRPLKKAHTDGAKLRGHFKYLKDGILLSNLGQVKNALTLLDEDLTAVQKDIRPLVWVKLIPLVHNYYKDAENILAAGKEGVGAGKILTEALFPVAAKIGFTTGETGDTPPPSLSGEERIKGLVAAMPILAGKMEEISPKLSLIGEKLDKVNPSRYPKNLRVPLSQGKKIALELDLASEDLKKLFLTLPQVLGDPTPQKYLVLFQNDKELRPTGGFWTAYAIFTVGQGRIVEMSSGDMYFLDIDNRVPFYPPAPAVIQKYLKLSEWYIRDTNLSPDYKKSVETLEEFWARVPGVPKIDGVLAIDTFFVQGLLEEVGEIPIPPFSEPFSKDNVVYQLELYANVLRKREAGRKDVVGVLMREIIHKVFALPGGRYDDFLKRVLSLASEKHLLLYFHNQEAQDLAEKYNLAGRISDFEGDYLHVNDANFAGRKANWYMEEKVTKEIKIEKGKRTESTVTIDYENTGAYHSEWNTGYRDYVRIYVPKGSTLISSSGSLSPVETFEDLGKTVFAGYIACDPKKKASFMVKYELPEGVIEGKKYNLLIQKQPGTDGHRCEVLVNGKKKEFELSTDREIIFQL